MLLTVKSDKPPISFSIKIRPQASNYEPVANNCDGEEHDSDEEDEEDEEDNDDQQGLSIELLFTLPPKYPDEKPSVQILDSSQLEESELSELLDTISRKAEESIGTVMVFMLVSDVVEWLVTKSDREAIALEQEKEKKLQEIEAEEKKRFAGTPVTVQTFLAWKAKFDAELLKAKIEEQKQSDQGGPKRLTGREMFESDKTLAESDLNFVEDLDQNQIEALLHNMDLEDVNENEEFELGESGDDDDDDEDEDFDIDDEESVDDEESSNSKKRTSKK